MKMKSELAHTSTESALNAKEFGKGAKNCKESAETSKGDGSSGGCGGSGGSGGDGGSAGDGGGKKVDGTNNTSTNRNDQRTTTNVNNFKKQLAHRFTVNDILSPLDNIGK